MSELTKTFNKSGAKPAPPPFSLRLTFEERAMLEKAAGGMPLGAYIRAQLLENQQSYHRRAQRRPVKDHQALGHVIGELGKARIANNLNQLAKAVHTGSLPVTPDTEKAILEACAGVENMRGMLMMALDFLPKESPS